MAGYFNEVLLNLKNQMTVGIPELQVPVLEPLDLGSFTVAIKDKSRYDLVSNFSNMHLDGLSTFDLNNLKVDLAHLKVQFELKFKFMNISGRYNMNGTVLHLLPVFGTGNCEFNATKVEIDVSSGLEKQSNGKLLVKGTVLDVDFEDIAVHFHGLLGGGLASGAANGVLAAFSPSVADKAKPKIADKLAATLEKVLNKKLQQVDVGKFL